MTESITIKAGVPSQTSVMNQNANILLEDQPGQSRCNTDCDFHLLLCKWDTNPEERRDNM